MASPMFLRSYKATTLPKATVKFQSDAALAAVDGFSPVAQSWVAPRWGAAGTCMALAVIFFLLGLFAFAPAIVLALVFLVLGIISPDSQGELTVTFQRTTEQPGPAPTPSSPATTAPDHLGSLETLITMRDRGLITPEDFEAKKAELLGRM